MAHRREGTDASSVTTMDANIIRRPDEDQLANVAAVKQAIGNHHDIRVGDEDLWILGGEVHVAVDGRALVVVPVGFTTDGASVPAIAQVITGWDPWEPPQRWAGVVHDWLYHQVDYTRRQSDQVFKSLLRSERAGAVKTELMYRAVRWFGGPAYRRNQRWGWQSKIFRSNDTTNG